MACCSAHHDRVGEAAQQHDQAEDHVHDADLLVVDAGEPLAPEVAPEPELGERARGARCRRARPRRRSRPGSARAAAAPPRSGGRRGSWSRHAARWPSASCLGQRVSSDAARGGRRGEQDDGVRRRTARSTRRACRARRRGTARCRRRSPAARGGHACSACRPGRCRRAASSAIISSMHIRPSSTQRLTIASEQVRVDLAEAASARRPRSARPARDSSARPSVAAVAAAVRDPVVEVGRVDAVEA